MMIPGQLSLIGFYNSAYQIKTGKSIYPADCAGGCGTRNGVFLKTVHLSGGCRHWWRQPESTVQELYSFHRIALPIMSPGIATMAIMAFIGNWNNYLLPMIILNKNEKFTLPVMMATLKASTDIQRNQGAIYLAVAISVIPILIVFCFCSKYIISSISAGSVKE